MPVTLHATARPADDTHAESKMWDVTADTHDQALVHARAAVPAGWVLLHVRTAP